MKALQPTDAEVARLAHRELEDYARGAGRPIAFGKIGNLLVIACCLAIAPLAHLIRLSLRLVRGTQR